jgi:hypothetical protein
MGGETPTCILIVGSNEPNLALAIPKEKRENGEKGKGMTCFPLSLIPLFPVFPFPVRFEQSRLRQYWRSRKMRLPVIDAPAPTSIDGNRPSKSKPRNLEVLR